MVPFQPEFFKLLVLLLEQTERDLPEEFFGLKTSRKSLPDKSLRRSDRRSPSLLDLNLVWLLKPEAKSLTSSFWNKHESSPVQFKPDPISLVYPLKPTAHLSAELLKPLVA